MSSMLAELTQRARSLPPQERAQLAEDLLDSLQEMPSPEIGAEWDAEILRRINEYEGGCVQLIRAEDVFAEARRLTM